MRSSLWAEKAAEMDMSGECLFKKFYFLQVFKYL